MLGVSPNTLRSWERRYGFPQPLRSPGGHRQYALAEIESLRLILAETHNVSSAISLARERGDGPPSPARLSSAFCAFDEGAANALLEESLMLRSLERTVQEILLEAVGKLHDAEHPGPEYEFAWRHATGWMSAMKRLCGPASHTEGILVLDGSLTCDFDGLHAQALELMLRRAGLRTLTLSPAVDATRLVCALRALTPKALVLTGRGMPLDCIGRLVYSVRRFDGEITVFDYRGAVPDTGASTVCRLGPAPAAARDELRACLEVPRIAAQARAPGTQALAATDSG